MPREERAKSDLGGASRWLKATDRAKFIQGRRQQVRSEVSHVMPGPRTYHMDVK